MMLDKDIREKMNTILVELRASDIDVKGLVDGYDFFGSFFGAPNNKPPPSTTDEPKQSLMHRLLKK